MATINLGRSYDEAKDEQLKQEQTLPVGYYDFEIVKASLVKGADAILIEMEVKGGEFSGKHIWQRVAYAGPGSFRFMHFVDCFNTPPWDGMEVDTDAFIGLTANIEVTHRTHENKIYEDLKLKTS